MRNETRKYLYEVKETRACGNAKERVIQLWYDKMISGERPRPEWDWINLIHSVTIGIPF